jgi:hypothetical protein
MNRVDIAAVEGGGRGVARGRSGGKCNIDDPRLFIPLCSIRK